MSPTTGHGTINDNPALGAIAAPTLTLPAPPERLATDAQHLLQWRGTALGPMKLLGRRVLPVAELRPDIHAERLCLGPEPITDRSEVETWSWPEMQGRVPRPAVYLGGVLAVARHWRSALIAAAPFAQYTSAAIVVPAAAAVADDFVDGCLLRARQFGVAVLTADEDGLHEELAGRPLDPCPAPEDTITRWLHEYVYATLLDAE